jgi:hypothetical protein
MDIPLSNAGCDAMYDLPGRIIVEYEKRGFVYGGRRVIWKEPLMVRNRTMMKSLAHKSIVDDSSKCSVANADYLLVFRKTGYLLDGQHRLLACIQANMPLTTFIVFNIPDGAFAMIDIGRKRTNTDAFFVAKIANSNVAAAATRWIMIHDQDPTFRHLTFTNDEMYIYYKQNLDNALFHECVTHAVEIEASTRALSPAGQRRNYCPAGPMAAYLYFFMMKNRKQASQFVGELVNMQRHGRVYIKAIRDRMDANSGRIHEVVRNALLVQAWNAFREGGRVSKQLMKWDWSEDFPVIR